jgi:phosphoribosyl-dephospho-CoA transferase
MTPDLAVHTLLRVAGPESVRFGESPEPWVADALRLAPWVVVRRAEACGDAIPVGVRGSHRAQRCAAWIEARAVLETATPEHLARARGWAASPRRDAIPALRALDAVEAIMREGGLANCWGPAGSVGFELASGHPSATASSDLDLVVRAGQPLQRGHARALAAALDTLSVRTDVLIETPHGAVALLECVGATENLVLRTRRGPRLVAANRAADGRGVEGVELGGLL